MTLEEILECNDPALLEKLSDKELNDIFSPYFPTTKPSLVVRSTAHKETKLNHTQQKALDIMKEHGIDMGDIFGRKKK